MPNSIYRKFIIHLIWTDIPREGQRPIEFCPYNINMLNAVEETAQQKIASGTLTEHSRTHWTFAYHNKTMNRPCEIDVVMTDTMLGEDDDGPRVKSDYAAPKSGPKFK